LLGEGTRGARLGELGAAAAALLPARRVPVLARAVRGGRRRLEEPRRVPAAAGALDADRARRAAQQRRDPGCGVAREPAPAPGRQDFSYVNSGVTPSTAGPYCTR